MFLEGFLLGNAYENIFARGGVENIEVGPNMGASIQDEVYQMDEALGYKPEVISLALSQDDELTFFDYLFDWLHFFVNFLGLAA